MSLQGQWHDQMSSHAQERRGIAHFLLLQQCFVQREPQKYLLTSLSNGTTLGAKVPSNNL